MKQLVTRRNFLHTAVVAGATIPFFGLTAHPGVWQTSTKRKVHIFSKHLHWLDYKAMADFVAECGFDGADLTVRPGGHVEPARVRDDLPLVVEAFKSAGVEVEMITTAILKADEPHAEQIIRTAGQLGIKIYRMGWYSYNPQQRINENLAIIESNLKNLALLNQRHSIRGAYQNHAGAGFGSPVWDLAGILEKINSPWIGCQFDVRHATVEGTNSWTLGFEVIKPYINSLDVKDFRWTNENGKSKAENVPLGQGTVDFETYFERIRALPVTVPVCLHMEYPLGGAEHGDRKITLLHEEIKKAMVRDLQYIRYRI